MQGLYSNIWHWVFLSLNSVVEFHPPEQNSRARIGFGPRLKRLAVWLGMDGDFAEHKEKQLFSNKFAADKCSQRTLVCVGGGWLLNCAWWWVVYIGIDIARRLELAKTTPLLIFRFACGLLSCRLSVCRYLPLCWYAVVPIIVVAVQKGSMAKIQTVFNSPNARFWLFHRKHTRLCPNLKEYRVDRLNLWLWNSSVKFLNSEIFSLMLK